MEHQRRISRAAKDFYVFSILSILALLALFQPGIRTYWLTHLLHPRHLALGGLLTLVLVLSVLLLATIAFGLRRLHDHVKMQADLRAGIFVDSLTGLLNRRGFTELGEQLLKRHNTACLVYIDSDRFKFVNDTYGHRAGNDLLVMMAGRMKQAMPEDACIARLGGDEFVVLFGLDSGQGSLGQPLSSWPVGFQEYLSFEGPKYTKHPEDPEHDLDDRSAEAVARRLQTTFDDPFPLYQHSLHLTASLGVSIYPRDGSNLTELVQSSDLAMYEAKSRRTSPIMMYHPGLRTRMEEWMSLRDNLQQALINREFFLVYQPIINLKTNRVSGCEALIRWNHPHRGVLTPDSFIAMAEESPFILDIGDHVIETSLHQLSEWATRGHQGIAIGINVSVNQIQNGRFVDVLEHTLRAKGIRPWQVLIEVTERIMMPDDSKTLETIRRLRDMGCRLSVDDFGEGFASIRYLTTMDVDIVKIDRSIVMGIEHDHRSRTVCRFIIQLAHQLGTKVVAEGVEDEAQLTMLRQMDCDYAQGYLFSRPVLPDEFPFSISSIGSDEVPGLEAAVSYSENWLTMEFS